MLVTLLLSPIHRLTASGDRSIICSADQSKWKGARDNAHRTLDCTKGSHSERPLSTVQTRIARIDVSDLESSRRTDSCTYSRFAIGDNRFLGFPQARLFFLYAGDVANVNIQAYKMIRVALNPYWVQGLIGNYALSFVECGVLRSTVYHLGQA